jgi:hypothetical protein
MNRKSEKPAKPPPKADRTAREAAALRENLRKRKEQAQKREEAKATGHGGSTG